MGDIKTIRIEKSQSPDLQIKPFDLDAIDLQRDRAELVNHQTLPLTFPSFLAIVEDSIAEVKKKRPM